MTVLAVTGLTREAGIVAGDDVLVLASGGRTGSLAERIEAMLSPEVAGLISIGIAGALDPALKVGDAVIASRVTASDEQWSADKGWRERLAVALPGVRQEAIAGADRMIIEPADKLALRQATGAACVDMESHVTAAVAQRRGLPFAVVRIISDASHRALPKAVQVGMKPDGGMDLAAVLRSLAGDPRQLPGLIRTGLEAEAAFRALVGVRGRLGPTLGLADI